MRMCPHRIGEQVDFHTSDDPNALWPQTTWDQVQGSFALASNSSHALGSTGGAESRSYTPAGTVGGHALTIAEMPAHRHPQNINGNGTDGWKNTYGAAVTMPHSGGSAAGYSYSESTHGWSNASAARINTDNVGGVLSQPWLHGDRSHNRHHAPVRHGQQVEASRLAGRRVA